MIIDNIKNLKKYKKLIPSLLLVEDYLKNSIFRTLKAGAYHLPGDDIIFYLFDYYNKSVIECIGEAHRQYIDLHIIVSGSETIGVLDGSSDAFESYDEVNDYCIAKGKFRYIDLNEDDFVIFFPKEGHVTGGHKVGFESNKVKRLVFKIPHPQA